MACEAQAVPGERKGIHASARRTEPAKAGIAPGKDRKEIPIRRTKRKSRARGYVRRAQPAGGVSLHVWSGMERRLSQLFVYRRPVRLHRSAHGAERYAIGRGIESDSAGDRSVQEENGMEVPVGVVVWKRFQLRFPRLIFEGRHREREGYL